MCYYRPAAGPPSAPAATISVSEYLDVDGRSAFGNFFDRLSASAASKVTSGVEKMEQGHTSGLKSLGGGLSEWVIDWGPGLRIYIHRDGHELLLLMGGSYGKGAQNKDIRDAKKLLQAYKKRKKARRKTPGC